MKHSTAVVKFVIGIFTLVLLFLVVAYTGRQSVFILGIVSLLGLALLKRTRPLSIAPFWGLVIPLGIGLTLIPIDVKFDGSFPDGVWIRPAVWGLLSGPIPRDAEGVPKFWWSRSCIVFGNEPRWALVVGHGGSREAMAEKYRYESDDFQTGSQIDRAVDAYFQYYADHDTYAGLDLVDSEYYEDSDCVTLESEGYDDFFVIKGTHCRSPHVFEMTMEDGHPEWGKVRRVD
jgi:hypothetical protein